jgi:glycosyltransferase involved in cell wall biosynthesis
MALVSVIVPNFNHTPFLQRRIDSILSQTYTDFELILLDDCSSDNSAEILLLYQNHPKVTHIVFNEKNSGSPFIQWNKGFALAKGEFIWIAESDDWCEPTLLETLVAPLQNDINSVLSYCQSLVVNLEGEIIYKSQFPELNAQLNGSQFLKKYMFGDCSLINSGMAVFRKSVLINIDDSYLDFKSAGDWMFWSQICAQGNVCVTGKYLNYFTRHSRTVSSKAITTGQDFFEGNRVFRWIEDRVKPTENEIRKALQLRLAIYYQQEKLYADNRVRKIALDQFLTLSKSSALIYWKKKLRMIVRGFFNSNRNV